MQRVSEQGFDIGLLDLLAGVHDNDALRRLGDHAKVVRDQNQSHPEFFLQIQYQRQYLGLYRDIKRGGRLVGDQQRRPARQRHRDHRALAHASRQLMRVLGCSPLGLWDSDKAQHFDGLVPCLLVGHRPMQANRLGDLVSDPHHRIERGHRLLEDH